LGISRAISNIVTTTTAITYSTITATAITVFFHYFNSVKDCSYHCRRSHQHRRDILDSHAVAQVASKVCFQGKAQRRGPQLQFTNENPVFV